MINAIKVVILAIAGLIIALPFFRDSETQTAQFVHGSKEELLLSEKESLYSTIKELDFDYEMGKLSDEDYKQLKNEYTEKAVVVLKDLDQMDNKEM